MSDNGLRINGNKSAGDWERVKVSDLKWKFVKLKIYSKNTTKYKIKSKTYKK